MLVTLFIPGAWSAPPCDNVKVVETKCADDKGSVSVSFALPDMPGTTPVRSLDMRVLRIQSAPEQAYRYSSSSGGRGFYTRATEDTTADEKKISINGPCGGTLKNVEVAWQAWVIKGDLLDVRGPLSELSSWLYNEPEAQKRGIYAALEQQYGSQKLVVRWMGVSDIEVHPTVIQGPDGDSPGESLGGQVSSGGFAPVFEQSFSPPAEVEPFNDPMLRVQVLDLESQMGSCRLENIEIAK